MNKNKKRKRDKPLLASVLSLVAHIAFLAMLAMSYPRLPHASHGIELMLNPLAQPDYEFEELHSLQFEIVNEIVDGTLDTMIPTIPRDSELGNGVEQRRPIRDRGNYGASEIRQGHTQRFEEHGPPVVVPGKSHGNGGIFFAHRSSELDMDLERKYMSWLDREIVSESFPTTFVSDGTGDNRMAWFHDMDEIIGLLSVDMQHSRRRRSPAHFFIERGSLTDHELRNVKRFAARYATHFGCEFEIHMINPVSEQSRIAPSPSRNGLRTKAVKYLLRDRRNDQ